MKRTTVHLFLAAVTLIALILLVALLNAPRMLDSYADIETARAHQAAAEAMQTQATATTIAVIGILCLTGMLALLLLGGLGLAVYLSLAVRFPSQPWPTQSDGRTALPFSQPGRWPQALPRRPTRSRPLLPSYSPPAWPPSAPPTPWRPEDEASLPAGMDWSAWDWPDEDFPAF